MGGKNPRFFDFQKTPSKTCILALLGGGTPPPPLPPSIQPLLTFFQENHHFFIKFYKIFFIFFFSSPSGWAGGCRRQLPPWRVRGGRAQCNSEGGTGIGLSFLFNSGCVYAINAHYSIASVRTRNALHVVGAQSLFKWVTARLAQGSVGRQVAQTHHENHNLTFYISS